MNTELSKWQVKQSEVACAKACAKVQRIARRGKELGGQGESSLENKSSQDYREYDWTVESPMNIWPYILYKRKETLG